MSLPIAHGTDPAEDFTGTKNHYLSLKESLPGVLKDGGRCACPIYYVKTFLLMTMYGVVIMFQSLHRQLRYIFFKEFLYLSQGGRAADKE